MIHAQDDLAWVRQGDGNLLPFDEHRLAASIFRIAERAGTSDWWLAESIAAAIHVYIIKYRSEAAIPCEEIVEIIAGVLSALGYARVSEAPGGRANSVSIRLDELTKKVVPGFELEFFHRLDCALTTAAGRGLLVMEVLGLRPCVMQLRAARRWTAGCRQQADDIVEHVRKRVMRLRPAEARALKLAVLE